ncbi:MAG TPA: DnaJ domain-containing protein [Bacilli bacterium]|nr:DnaJ domain-containing protein [Bacilli bacterium]
MEKFDITKAYYQILRVDEKATQEEIEKSYLFLKGQLDPSFHVDEKETFEKLMNEVDEAYLVLSNPELRKAYDEALKAAKDKVTTHTEPIKVIKTDDSSTAKVTAQKGRGSAAALPISIIAILIALGVGISSFFGSCGRNRKDDEETTTKPSYSDTTTEPSSDDLEGLLDEYAFVDPEDINQLNKRASILHAMFVKAGIDDYSVSDIVTQLMFINGSFGAEDEDQAYDTANDILELMGKYGTSVKGVTNFAGDELDMNDVAYAVKLNAYLTDDTDHVDVLNDIATLFVKTATAKTKEEIKANAEKMINIEAQLMVGTYKNSEGEAINFINLTDAEQFVAGIMFQIIAPTITTALGEKYNVVIDAEHNASRKVIENFYNPMCDGKYNTENVWARAYNGLVEDSLSQKNKLVLK